MKLPFVGSRYERNFPSGWIASDQRMPWYDGPELPVHVTVLDNEATHFFDPGIIFLMDGVECKMSVERFLRSYHPIENVVTLRAGEQ